MHRRNAAERAIRTFKNHFIAGLCAVNPAFPLHLWDRLLDQAECTLNMLRTSRLNPNLSAYEQLHGIFDFQKTPLTPPEIKVIIHEKPSQRASWGPHGSEGWYLGRSPNHYRSHHCYRIRTKAELDVDTVDFFPHNFDMPGLSASEKATIAAQELTEALLNPSDKSLLKPSESTHEALTKLSHIFTNQIAKTKRCMDAPAPRVKPTQEPIKRAPDPPLPQTAPSPRVNFAKPRTQLEQAVQDNVPPPTSESQQRYNLRSRTQRPNYATMAANMIWKNTRHHINAVIHPETGFA